MLLEQCSNQRQQGSGGHPISLLSTAPWCQPNLDRRRALRIRLRHPPSSLSIFVLIGESIDIRACVRVPRAQIGPENVANPLFRRESSKAIRPRFPWSHLKLPGRACSGSTTAGGVHRPQLAEHHSASRALSHGHRHRMLVDIVVEYRHPVTDPAPLSNQDRSRSCESFRLLARSGLTTAIANTTKDPQRGGLESA